LLVLLVEIIDDENWLVAIDVLCDIGVL